jgi:hypothetical protein
MRKVVGLFVLLFVLGVTVGLSHGVDTASDAFVRDQVVKLYQIEAGQCTGVHVQAPSGKVYILTAAHCDGLLNEYGEVFAEVEGGGSVVVSFVAYDYASDLMLLSGVVGKPGVKVADSHALYEKVHTLTHGHGAPTFRTDGEMLGPDLITWLMFDVRTEDDAEHCQLHIGARVVATPFGELLCIRSINEQQSTARALPGSSGGPALNAAGELIGIVSTGNDFFTNFVLLTDIHAFLSDK